MIKTVSLETAKLLKENGFRQDTHFWHSERKYKRPDEENKVISSSYIGHGVHAKSRNIYAAPCTDELLEELPCDIDGLGLIICKIDSGNDGIYYVSYENCITHAYLTTTTFKNEYLPESLASMWLWLKKEGLI